MASAKAYSNFKPGLPSRSFKYKTAAGFTLLEILIAIGIMITVGTIGFVSGLGQYQSYVLKAERITVVSLLQQARSRAMNNVGEVPHGLSIQNQDFVLFEGGSYASRDQSADQLVPRSGLITFSGISEAVFSRLSGDLVTSAGNFILSNGATEFTITLNNEGRISW